MSKKYIINDGEDGVFETLEEAIMAWEDYIGGDIQDIEIYEASVEECTLGDILNAEQLSQDILDGIEQSIYEEMSEDADYLVFNNLSPVKRREFSEYIKNFVAETSTLKNHLVFKDKKRVEVDERLLIDLFGEEDYKEMALSQ